MINTPNLLITHDNPSRGVGFQPAHQPKLIFIILIIFIGVKKQFIQHR